MGLLFLAVTVALVSAVLVLSEQHFAGDPVARAQRGDIAGLSEGSMVLEGNFRRALAEVRKRSGRSTINNLRLAPVSLDMTVRDSDGRQSIYRVDSAFRTRKQDFGDSVNPGFAFADVDLDAPARITTAVARRARARPEDLDYMVLNRSPAFPGREAAYTWVVFLKREIPIARRQWQAAGNGTDVRGLGELPRSERRRQARAQREARAVQRQINARARCFTRAKGTDALRRCSERFR